MWSTSGWVSVNPPKKRGPPDREINGLAAAQRKSLEDLRQPQTIGLRNDVPSDLKVSSYRKPPSPSGSRAGSQKRCLRVMARRHPGRTATWSTGIHGPESASGWRRLLRLLRIPQRSLQAQVKGLGNHQGEPCRSCCQLGVPRLPHPNSEPHRGRNRCSIAQLRSTRGLTMRHGAPNSRAGCRWDVPTACSKARSARAVGQGRRAG